MAKGPLSPLGDSCCTDARKGGDIVGMMLRHSACDQRLEKYAAADRSEAFLDEENEIMGT